MYCEDEDLLIGQLATRLPPQVVPNDFIEAASSEIDAKLGFIYKTPFVLDQEENGHLPPHQAKLIKDITAKLASGRIMLAATAAMEHSTVHQYGASLIRDATISLMAIANSDVRLTTIRVDAEGNDRPDAVSPEDNDPLAYVPGAANRDSIGGVVAFENNFMNQNSWPFSYSEPYRPNDG